MNIHTITLLINWATPITIFCPFIIGIHNIVLEFEHVGSFCIILPYGLSLIHSITFVMFNVSPEIATCWAICANIELLRSSNDGRLIFAELLIESNSNIIVKRDEFVANFCLN